MDSKVRMNFWLTKKMYEFIEAMAIRDGRSMSDVLREALRDYVEKHISTLKEGGLSRK